ncbi:MAG: hypothetical protein M3303_15560, partial [Gemmatimonadota bacterium]|nr:hypothetical protein [Gemmatimonadota bacterium]
MTGMRRVARAATAPAFVSRASVAVLALLASAASFGNGFVFDDGPIVQLNSRVHTLARWWEAFGHAYWPPHWGNTNYRPLTILSFGVQWALGDGSPAVFHAVSVVLYVATSLAVLALARLVLPASAAWVVAALFAVHPVHVEAVANVVGQSELLVALSSVLATTIYVPMRSSGRRVEPRAVAAIGALYAVACFSKETGFLLPGLLLAAEGTVVTARLDPARRTLRTRVHELGVVYAVCGGIGLAYLSARHA